MKNVRLTLSAEDAAAIPSWTPPEGYTLRCYEPSDYDEWFELLTLIGPLGIWSAEKFAGILEAPEYREGARLIRDNADALVGSAYGGWGRYGYGAADSDRNVASMGGIAIHPEHRRKGLGFGVCAAVIGFILERGPIRIILGTGTSDIYLPARKLYEKLGFQYEDKGGNDDVC